MRISYTFHVLLGEEERFCEPCGRHTPWRESSHGVYPPGAGLRWICRVCFQRQYNKRPKYLKGSTWRRVGKHGGKLDNNWREKHDKKQQKQSHHTKKRKPRRTLCKSF